MTEPSDEFEAPDWANDLPDPVPSDFPQEWMPDEPTAPTSLPEAPFFGIEDSLVLPETLAPNPDPEEPPQLEAIPEPTLDLSLLESLLPSCEPELPELARSDVETVFDFAPPRQATTAVVKAEPVTEAEGFVFTYGAVIDLASRLTARSLRVAHVLPPGVELVSTSPPAMRFENKLLWMLNDIRAGKRLPIRVTVRTRDPHWRPRQNIAKFRATFSCRGLVSVPLSRPSVSIAISGSTQVEVGRSAALQVRIQNTGNWPLREAKLGLEPSPEFCDLALEPLRVPPLEANQHVVLACPILADKPGRGWVRAVLTLPGGERVVESWPCEATQSQLHVVIETPGPWHVGHSGRVRVILSNPGTAAARRLLVSLQLPTDHEVESNEFLASDSQALTEVPELAPAETRHLELALTPLRVGVASICVRVEAGEQIATAEQTFTAGIAPQDSDTILDGYIRDFAGSPSPDFAALPSLTRNAGRKTEDSHVVFELAGVLYALPLGAVREVCREPKVTPVPGAPAWLAGVANVRGDVVSLVDLRGFLGESPAPPSSDRRLLVLAEPGSEVTTGFLVDRVRGLRSIPSASITEPAAPLESRVADSLRGVAQSAGLTLVVLAPERLLHSPELFLAGPA